MKEIEEIIRQQRKILPGDILKIDSFLNHKIDINVMDIIGKEFNRLFGSLNPDKILTIETSGVCIAYSTSINMNKQPVIYAKKKGHFNISNESYVAKTMSYTEKKEYTVEVAKEYLRENEKVLIIDDFLANGEALNSLLDICKQAKVEVVGIGVVVAKMYQPGYERIRKMYNNIEILAKIKSMSKDGEIEFE